MRKTILLSAMLAIMLMGGVPALAQGVADGSNRVSGDGSDAPPAEDPGGIVGTLTDVSGSVVLVEEDPSDWTDPMGPPENSPGSPKGYFTVTEETEILDARGGEPVPANFGDLVVGQIVEATYAGAVAESYPTQGNAGSIVILEDGGPPPGPPTGEEFATLSFELAIECEPPPYATFLGFTSLESVMTTPLSDPDGDGLYTGSMTVNRFPPGPRPVPPGVEPISLSPVRIVQGPPTGTGPLGPEFRVIEDFGTVKLDEDKTLEASVSFCEDGGSGNGDGSGTADDIKTLPATSGALPIAAGAGALLIAAGFLLRRIVR